MTIFRSSTLLAKGIEAIEQQWEERIELKTSAFCFNSIRNLEGEYPFEVSINLITLPYQVNLPSP